MENVKGKRLLLLGGIAHAMEIVRAAQEMGVVVYVTDYYEMSPAKTIADKAVRVSTTDVEALTKFCRDEKIDGVITGFIDSMLPYCEKTCTRMGLPFWGTQEQIEVCIHKGLFKDACRRYGVPLAKEYSLEHDGTGLIRNEVLEEIKYPVIVKPVDNSGSRGVYVCRNERELEENFRSALSFSKSKQVLVEQCLTGQHVNMYYTLSNGEIYLSAMADRYVDYLDGKSAPLPVCLIHPSRYLEDYLAETDEKIKSMFRGLGMRDGVAFVQGFRCDDGQFVIYEMGYRLNGGGTYSLIEACSGYNQLKMLIRFSLTGQMGETEALRQGSAKFERLAVNYVLSVSGGEIDQIRGLDRIRQMDCVCNVIQVRFPGDSISGKGGSAQVIAYVLLVVDDKKALASALDEIKEHVQVTDRDGNDLQVVPFDVSVIPE
ncbi:MAG: ATP-grasp domain-containing protein [Ruminococcaceae bacterium]|nr:ATP-grasp domain-containing protein [Oscillospiraceae bacterium]